ncbi:MAG: hypothetical protein ACTSX9_03035 [Candidatus Njordarchaeales archaeon]
MENKTIRICFKCILRRPFVFFSSAKPFILSHHPECSNYINDYIVIRGTKLCIGCTFGYIPALITLVVGVIFDLWEVFGKHILQLLIITLIVQVFYYDVWRRNKTLKIISKIFLGFFR